jgi:hypothetical protein
LQTAPNLPLYHTVTNAGIAVASSPAIPQRKKQSEQGCELFRRGAGDFHDDEPAE